MTRGDLSRGGIVVALFCALAVFASPASAGPVSFELRLCEDAWCVLDPTNANFAQQAGNLSQHELFSMRDAPYMQLMNTSPAGGGEITRFSLTIGDLFNNAQHYDWTRIIDHSPGITWQFVMPDTANNGQRSDAIDILFTGFTPGKLVRFQTDIDNDQGAIDLFTDYRQVLFDLGGNNQSDNAVASTYFREAGLPPAVAITQLPDFAQVGPTNLGYRLLSECGPESVNPFITGGQAIVVPEPATVALFACGMLMLVGVYRQRRKVLA
jgi:hypothetical protein